MTRFLLRLLLLGLLAGCAKPPLVEVARVSRTDLVDSFREQAETQLRKLYVVSLPVAGRIGRIDLEPGEAVRSGQTLVTFDRLPSTSKVDERQAEVQELQAEERQAADDAPEAAEVARAQALLLEARKSLAPERARLKESLAIAAQARVELERARRLHADGALPRQQLEQARLEESRARAQIEEVRGQIGAQQAREEAALHQLEAARALQDRRQRQSQAVSQRVAQADSRLQRSLHEASQAFVTSPIDGVVVERFVQGPGPLSAGEKLLSLGRLQDLEAMSEVLTQDALRLKKGGAVQLYPGPGRPPLEARVSRIEPRGFTKLSSLGVEQKRVRVFMDLTRPPSGLGAGYRLEAEFVVASHPQVLALPRPALMQKPNGSFYVFKIENGRLRECNVELGVAEDLRVAIRSGLNEGDAVVAAPDSSLQEGDEVRTQPDPNPP